MAKEIEAERKGAKCLAISADVRNITSMEEAVNQTIKEFGRIDFVIAGAAGNFLATIDVYPILTLFNDRTYHPMLSKRFWRLIHWDHTILSKPRFRT
jgi:NAD(P)-dependent dehydrogenase (short-subunit alcohol dehydrogenase family)